MTLILFTLPKRAFNDALLINKMSYSTNFDMHYMYNTPKEFFH